MPSYKVIPFRALFQTDTHIIYISTNILFKNLKPCAIFHPEFEYLIDSSDRKEIDDFNQTWHNTDHTDNIDNIIVSLIRTQLPPEAEFLCLKLVQIPDHDCDVRRAEAESYCTK